MNGSFEPPEISGLKKKRVLFLLLLFHSFNTVCCPSKWVLKTYPDHEIKREEIFSPPKEQKLKEKNNISSVLKSHAE